MCTSASGNKSGLRSIDDWRCPRNQLEHQRSHTTSSVTPARSPLLRRVKDTDYVDNVMLSPYPVDAWWATDTAPLVSHLLLSTIGVLVTMLTIIGLVSYWRASSSS